MKDGGLGVPKLLNPHDYIEARNLAVRAGGIMLRNFYENQSNYVVAGQVAVTKNTEAVNDPEAIPFQEQMPSEVVRTEEDLYEDSGMKRAISPLVPQGEHLWPEPIETGVAKLAGTHHQRKLALILPAHDEELIIQSTIMSAKRSGMDMRDIYIVDDASTDRTVEKVLELLPESNVLLVPHSGKAGAVYKAIKYFEIEERYKWVHVADADSLFATDYFRIYRRALSDEYVAAVGFVQSLKGNWLCTYRCFSYTYGQHLFRRLQSWLGMILVMPGPVSSYRTNIIKHLNFNTGSFTEDFDITVQIHRNKLGKIKFIPEAVNYTQDPRRLGDFYRQTLRWYRGWFQGVRRYRLGRGNQLIDINFFFQITEILGFALLFGLAIYALVANTNVSDHIMRILLLDIGITAMFAIFCAMITGRLRILLIFPILFLIRMAELGIYTQAFVEIIILRRFESRSEVGWKVAGRRYAVSVGAMEERWPENQLNTEA